MSLAGPAGGAAVAAAALMPGKGGAYALYASPLGHGGAAAKGGQGSISPPASSCSTGTAMGSGGAAAAHPAAIVVGAGGGGGTGGGGAGARGATTKALGVASMLGGAAGGAGPREWLYRLVTFPAYFTPCLSCCNGSRTPKREQLMTLFDTRAPHKVFCSHCPECQLSGTSGMLQVRRASFKDVVKATDIGRFGADVSGVQQYTLNGSKVIYLNREQAIEKKASNGTAAPAQCSVDGRAMMDKSSLYCSLKCKLVAEDPGFSSWLDGQDPSVRILADIAANAPPRPTVACKRGAVPTSSGGSSGSGSAAEESGGSGGGGSSSAAATAMTIARPKKVPRTTSSGGTIGAAAGAPAGHGSGGESAAPRAGGVAIGGGGSGGLAARARMLHRTGSAPGPSTAPGLSGVPAGLRPIRTSLGASGAAGGQLPGGLMGGHQGHHGTAHGNAGLLRQASLPSSFLEAALSEPQLAAHPGMQAGAYHNYANHAVNGGFGGCIPHGAGGPASCAAAPGGGAWLGGPAELDNALSSNGTIGGWGSWEAWESGLSTPTMVQLRADAATWEDGSLSPALVPAPAGGMADGPHPHHPAGLVGNMAGTVGVLEEWAWLEGASPSAGVMESPPPLGLAGI